VSGVIDQAIEEILANYPYPAIIKETGATIRSLAESLVKLTPDRGRLLDIGCGGLDKTIVFQNLGYSCFGCDDFQDPWYLSNENFDPVLEFARESGVDVHKLTDGYEIPWESGSFDVVTMTNVIEHLHESPRDILNLAGRLLKPGGLLLVAMPNSVNLRKRISVMRGRSNYTPVRGFFENDGVWRGHVREFTLQETCQIVEWNGFQVIHKKTFHGMLGNRLRNPVARMLFKGISYVRPDFRDGVMVGARKPPDWTERQPDASAMEVSLTDAWISGE
jgi:SAM-dependent methyltransferase